MDHEIDNYNFQTVSLTIDSFPVKTDGGMTKCLLSNTLMTL